MGWADCGTDSQGRPIGYAFEATCDHKDCDTEIDRGLSYVCGEMHGEDEISCEKYFCSKHKPNYVEIEDTIGNKILTRICDECAAALRASEEFIEDEEEGVLIRNERTGTTR